MNALPSSLSRVPTLLASRLSLSTISQTTREMLRTQEELVSGKRINRPSDDVVGTSAVSVLDDQLERRDQRLTNLTEADALIGSLDSSLGDLTDLLQEAKAVGLSQIGVGSDSATRQNQSQVISAILDAAVDIANRSQRGIHYFGGSAHASAPIVAMHGAYRYIGSGDGMSADLPTGSSLKLTMAGEQAYGALSGRVEGFVDLNPAMTATTRLADLNGARGQGVAPGSVTVTVNSIATTVDLTDAETVGDVVARVQAAMQAQDPGATMGIDPVNGDRFVITPSAGFTVTITDSVSAATAADLGLAGVCPGGVATSTQDVSPRLTALTALSSMSGLSLPLGTIRIRNANQVRDIDLSTATSVQDVMRLVEAENIGVRMEINEAGDRLNVRNELSGAAMSVEEVAGGTTATQLGIRSFHGSTLLADFNDGGGVGNVSGQIDPISGLPDPSLNTDFRVTLKDGRSFDVDIDGATTVQDVLDAINNAAAAAGVTPAEFTAGLVSSGNGIGLTDHTAGTTTSVTDLNNSTAAADLGILGSTTSATLAGEDRATVAVNSLFSHLMALRDALATNDERGIEFATARLDTDLGRAVEARADVGVRSKRIADATTREQDLKVQDQSLRSQIQDVDVTEAAVRFQNLQTALQAGYQITARSQQLSLLDFLR
ncbi:MAG: flagellin [Phycisphaerales bacterium]